MHGAGNAAVKPYCGQCCPKNYTEAHFAANPSDYSKHPPIFLSQTATVDNHADLCACKNYYETLQASHTGRTHYGSLLQRTNVAEGSFCIVCV